MNVVFFHENTYTWKAHIHIEVGPRIKSGIYRDGHTAKSAIIARHDDVIKGNIFRVTGPLCGEFTGQLWCFPWSEPQQTVE